MSHLINDQLQENLWEEIQGLVNECDDDIMQEYNEIAYENNLHPDDDFETILEIIFDQRWENMCH